MTLIVTAPYVKSLTHSLQSNFSFFLFAPSLHLLITLQTLMVRQQFNIVIIFPHNCKYIIIFYQTCSHETLCLVS